MNRIVVKNVVLCLLLISLVGCDRDNVELSDSLIKEIERNCTEDDLCDIAIPKITTFEWNKVVLFQTGSSRQEISERLGFQYQKQDCL